MSPTKSGGVPERAIRTASVSARSSQPPRWSIAVFAHNEAARIRSALESIVPAANANEIEVVVLANGCTDRTSDEVRACAAVLNNLTVVEIDVADKANAWNVYVHDVITPHRARTIETYFFMDGDVTLDAGALPLLAAALKGQPSAQAVGGMPATGRDRDAWRARMVRNGTLAGNLYALRSSFVDQLRQKRVRMPVGLIGEDLFLSWLVSSDAVTGTNGDGPRTIFCANAEFSFRSLSPARLGDYRTYWRRKWRYTLRALQLEMLMPVLKREGLRAMPADVGELYATAPLPSRMKWAGLETPMRTLAVLQIRAHRKSLQRSLTAQS